MCPENRLLARQNIRRIDWETMRDKLLLGKHVIRCGKTANSKAFEREVVVRSGVGVNAFDFSAAKR